MLRSTGSTATRGLLLILICFTLSWFSTLGYRKLIHSDEGRYAEIPREMVQSGNWVTPRLNNIKYFEKPALQYWTTAMGFEVFGESEWSARLWPALTGFLGVLLVFFTGRQLWGRDAGLYSAAVLGGSLWWIANGHFLTLDMGVSFFLTLALCCFVLAQRAQATPHERRNNMYLVWAAMALAVLSKGLIGLALPGMVLVAYSVINRDFAIWKRMHWFAGLLIFFAITTPWFVLVSQHNPEFPEFFFIHEHYTRFISTEHRREGAWWYFVPILLIGFVPWTTLLPSVFKNGQEGYAWRFSAERVLLLWSILIFLFFSKSGSKLPSYILPIFPALALLAGRAISEMPARRFAWHALPLVALGIGILVAIPHVAQLNSEDTPNILHVAYTPWLMVGGSLMIAGGFIAFILARTGHRSAAVITLSATLLTGGQIPLLGHNAYAPAVSAWQIAQQIKAHSTPETPIFSVMGYQQTLPFYLKRPVILVDFEDEFSFGQKQEPDKKVSLPDFVERWKNAETAIAVVEREDMKKVDELGISYTIVGEDPRRLAIAKE